MSVLYIVGIRTLPQFNPQEIEQIAKGSLISNGTLYSLQSTNIPDGVKASGTYDDDKVTFGKGYSRIVLIECEDRYGCLTPDDRIETFYRLEDFRAGIQKSQGS